MKKNKFLFICAAALLYACNNQSKEDKVTTDSTGMNAKMDTSMSNKSMTTDPATTSFLTDAADGGMTEVQFGQLAQDKSSNRRVKDFGTMMINDHSVGNDQIKQLAAQRNVPLPGSISAQHHVKKDELMKKQGKAFDKSFMDAMVKDHQEVIKMFENAANNSHDQQVKDFINNTLPTLKMHLDSARAIQKSIR